MMKNIWKYVIAALSSGILILLLTVLSAKSRAVRSERSCSGIEVEFRNDQGFISKADIKDIIVRDYGPVSGKRIEEIDIARIEQILDGRSSILKSEVYTTSDGILHAIIAEREPAVRFITPSGSWYADDTGFLFPMQKNSTSRVPIVDGAVPVDCKPGFKGHAEKASERKWIEGILNMLRWLDDHRSWKDAIAQIHVENDGGIVLIPVEGREKFIIGRPEDFGKKFGKIEEYYRCIVPARGAEYYSSVNVSFDGQIVCRK